jgi:hypothetical protein
LLASTSPSWSTLAAPNLATTTLHFCVGTSLEPREPSFAHDLRPRRFYQPRPTPARRTGCYMQATGNETETHACYMWAGVGELCGTCRAGSA